LHTLLARASTLSVQLLFAGSVAWIVPDAVLDVACCWTFYRFCGGLPPDIRLTCYVPALRLPVGLVTDCFPFFSPRFAVYCRLFIALHLDSHNPAGACARTRVSPRYTFRWPATLPCLPLPPHPLPLRRCITPCAFPCTPAPPHILVAPPYVPGFDSPTAFLHTPPGLRTFASTRLYVPHSTAYRTLLPRYTKIPLRPAVR